MTSTWLQMQHTIAEKAIFDKKQHEEEQKKLAEEQKKLEDAKKNKLLEQLYNKYRPIIKEAIEKKAAEGETELVFGFYRDDFSKTLVGETAQFCNYALCLQFLQYIVSTDTDLTGIYYRPIVSNLNFSTHFTW